ncbi:glutamyl-tRNA reductase [Occallatibacter riparius]|uniref:Glutamyl-tRNA reductase n=1 Tax=Occallatibacter riparius TaxID=1002689 RepID=A0A9J7BND3_9BACT|nr:glutamyl-tRNA reductase [Occallatibacter riparius]UWZ82422.1 glutamyl-tRNA reductase [Occallatibacter riparius]
MSYTVLGVNHKTAPIELRERIAISRDELPEVTRALAATPGVSECMIVSTCNRVELITATDSSEVDLSAFLCNQFGLDPALLSGHIYQHRDQQAVRHLFRVASSLDSMVVGESQILGQVKEAFATARAAGTVGSELDHLLQSAFSAAKKVRSETEIGSNSVSIASVAVELARKIFGSLQGRTVFLVGAGKMSELAARHLVQQGAGTILVTNRTMERAQRMAEPFNGQVIPFEKLYDYAAEADIIITSTGAPHHIFRREHGQAFLHKRRNRPMFFIDIAVPRDVDPAMNKVEGLFVYDIDDLQQVAAAHIAERKSIAAGAEVLVEGEVERFHQRRRTVNVAPVIVALQRQAEELRQAEIRRIQSRLGSLTAEQAAAVEALTRGLMNKFLHPPMQALKQAARENDAVRLDALCETYSLPNSQAGPEAVAAPAEQSNRTSPDAPAPERQTSVAGRR